MRRRISISLLLLSWATSSHAAYSNSNSILLGERAAGLGGAFTALSGDAAASPYYNPATSVLQSGNHVSAAVNVYNKFETNVGDTGDFTQAPQRLNRGFFRSLPSSSATILGFGSFAVGLSILVPDYEFYSGQIKGTSTTTSSLSTVDESLWVGGTFSTKLTKRDAAGLSLYYTARNLSRSVSDRVETGGGTGATLTTEEKNLTSNAVVAILGFYRKLSETWSMGLSYRAPSLPIAGEASYYKAVVQTTPYTSTVTNQGNLRAITKIPARVTVGFAREVKNVNTLSFDLQMYEGTSYSDLPELPAGAEDIQHRQIVNFALGYEARVRDWARLRLGFYSNLSNNGRPDLSKGQRQGDYVDQMGFSANVNFRTADATSFTFGGYYTGGSGDSTQLTGQSLQIVPKSQQVFTMLVATGFSF